MSWPEDALAAMLAWKARSPTLPDAARAHGQAWIEEDRRPILTRPSPKLLPQDFAEHNLLPSVRAVAVERFRRHDVAWHMEVDEVWEGRPSPHVLDSQIQCVNVLLGLPEARLFELVRSVVPGATSLVAVEDRSPVAFEWIGLVDHLGEGRGLPRRRGRFVTSADALLLAERGDGGRTAVLVEWKFTEMYTAPIRPFGPGGTDRRAVYRPRYEGPTSPFAERPPIDAFLHEPHYQLLRQALLAAGMVDTGELGVDAAVLLHLVPGRHDALHRLVPPGLAGLGDSLDAVWSRLLPGPRVRYAIADAQALYAATPELAERYGALAG